MRGFFRVATSLESAVSTTGGARVSPIRHAKRHYFASSLSWLAFFSFSTSAGVSFGRSTL
jgi:hypothetical protein